MNKFAEDLGHPEGPVRLSDGSWLVVEMRPDRNCVTKVSADGRDRRPIRTLGRPNGLAVDRHGTIWVADSNPAGLIELLPDGDVREIIRHCGAEPMLFCNDLCFGPDGMLYLTDSGMLLEDLAPNGKLREDYLTAPIDGRIYRVDPANYEIEKLASGLRFANGIAFDAAGRNVYVSESMTGNILCFPWDAGSLGEGRIFGNVHDPANQAPFKMADGMAFGEDGTLYVAVLGEGNIVLLDDAGSIKGRIKTNGSMPTNLAFGAPGERRIYVTEDEFGTIEMHDVDTDGVQLFNTAP